MNPEIRMHNAKINKPQAGHERRARTHPAILLIIVSLIVLHLSGCAVGYITFHRDDGNREQGVPRLEHIKVSYSYGTTTDALFALSFERTLRSRFHMLDLQPVKQAGADTDPERFVIRAEQRSDTRGLMFVPVAISFFSGALIPIIFTGHQLIVFTVLSPGGEERTFRYSYAERLYSWLPFMFFGPRFFMGINAGYDDYQEERLKLFDDITVRFMTEAAPFMLDHALSRR